MKNKNDSSIVSFIPLIFLILGMMLYANTCNHDYAWDDSIVIENNPYTQQGLDALGDIWTKPVYIVERPIYRPIPQTTFALEKTLYPEGNPSLGHGVNMLLYGLCCMFVFIFLRGLLSNYHYLFSFFASLLFTIHPIHTEVVANVKSRDEILSFLFSLLSLIAFRKFVENKNIKYLIAPIFLLLAAILSKANAVTILVIFPIVYFFQKNKTDRKTKNNYQLDFNKDNIQNTFLWLAKKIDDSRVFRILVVAFFTMTIIYNLHLLAALGIVISTVYLYAKGDGGEGISFLLGNTGLLLLSLFFGLHYMLYASLVFCLLYPAILGKWNWKNIILPTAIFIAFMISLDKLYFSIIFLSIAIFSYWQFRQNKKYSLSYIIPLGFGIASLVIGSMDTLFLYLLAFLMAYLKWFVKSKKILVGVLLVICTVGMSELYFAEYKKSLSFIVASSLTNKYEPQITGDTINVEDEKRELSAINNTIAKLPNREEKQATIAAVNLLYLTKLFYPNPLIHSYGINTIPTYNFKDLKPWLGILIYALLLLYALSNILKRDPVAFGILWYLITLSIYSHVFVLAPDTLAERFLFFPSLGFCIFFTFGLASIIKIDLNKKLLANPRNILFTGILFVVSGLGIMQTLDRNKAWENNRTLATETLPNAPNSAFIHINYSTEWYRYFTEIRPSQNANDFYPAIKAAERAIEIHPEYFYAMLHLGEMYLAVGEIDKAIGIYKQALQVNPEHIVASFKLGLIYYSKKEYQKGVDVMESSIGFYKDKLPTVLSPQDLESLHLFLARCYFSLDEMDEAISTLKKATVYQPDNSHYFELLSSMFLQKGNADEALIYLEKAKVMNPNNKGIEDKLNNLRDTY